MYSGLDQFIKSVPLTIRIMDQLNNDQLRERHWKRLEQIAGIDFQRSLDVKMDLKRFSEEITEMVESANNEMRMETQLADLDKTWREMDFQYKRMEDFPELQILSVPEENQVAAQNYVSSKDLSYFKVTLTDWQNKLMAVDRVLETWLEVQYDWTHLRSIFIGSEDIRRVSRPSTKR
jgi:dynein heavy chain